MSYYLFHLVWICAHHVFFQLPSHLWLIKSFPHSK
jgi:hypothetical protein